MRSLRGLSPGAVREALPVRLGAEAAGRAPTTITRLRAQGEPASPACRPRDLSGRDEVAIWGDGVPFTRRRADERLCTLAVVGARADGTQAGLAAEDGDRERPESGRTRSRALTRRGMTAPAGAVGDGARGVWNAGGRCGPRRASNAAGCTGSPPCATRGRSGCRRKRSGPCARAGTPPRAPTPPRRARPVRPSTRRRIRRRGPPALGSRRSGSRASIALPRLGSTGVRPTPWRPRSARCGGGNG